MSTLPEFVEIRGRLYEVSVVAGPLRHDGVYTRSLVDPETQQIWISDEVPECERGVILEKAVSAAQGCGSDSFRVLPLIS